MGSSRRSAMTACGVLGVLDEGVVGGRSSCSSVRRRSSASSMSSDQRSRSSRSSGATPSMSPIMISGSGAAMSHTKSHSPRSHTASMISSQTVADLVLAARAPGAGVKPRFTSLRRCQCSGSSMSIIIGIGPGVGPDAAGVRERRRVLRHGADVVVAGDAPHPAVPVDGSVLAHPGQLGVRVRDPRTRRSRSRCQGESGGSAMRRTSHDLTDRHILAGVSDEDLAAGHCWPTDAPRPAGRAARPGHHLRARGRGPAGRADRRAAPRPDRHRRASTGSRSSSRWASTSACSRPTTAATAVACAPGAGSGWPTAPTTSPRCSTCSASSRPSSVGYSMGGPVAQLLWKRHPREGRRPRDLRHRRPVRAGRPRAH